MGNSALCAPEASFRDHEAGTSPPRPQLPSPPEQTAPAAGSLRRTRTLATALYLLTASFLFADQNLLSPNMSAVAAEFQLDDLERDKKLGGDIAVAFFMVGVPASFLVGCLADAVRRRNPLFLAVVLLGAGGCLGTYFAATYRQLYLCRALTGFGVGGALPLVYSVLGDHYAPQERGRVSGVISMSCGIGISVGQGVAGVFGPRFGWRVPFLAVSLPAMVCAVAVCMCIPEVERGAGEKLSLSRDQDDQDVEMVGGQNFCTTVKTKKAISGAAPSPSSTEQGLYTQLNNGEMSKALGASSAFPTKNCGDYFANFYQQSIHPHIQTLKVLCRCPSVLLAVFQGAPGCVPWGIINLFLNDYLSSKGLSVQKATLVLLVFGVGNFIGTFVGGVGMSYLYVISPQYPSILSSLSAIAGCFPLWGLVNYNFGSDENGGGTNFATYSLLGAVAIVAGTLSGITGPIVKATLQNVTMPTHRGQAFALLNTFDDFGRGLGPAFVARMIETMGRKRAFNVGISGWIFCGFLNGLLFFTVGTDEERVRLGVQGAQTKNNKDGIARVS